MKPKHPPGPPMDLGNTRQLGVQEPRLCCPTGRGAGAMVLPDDGRRHRGGIPMADVLVVPYGASPNRRRR
jgi:hypothetical protein